MNPNGDIIHNDLNNEKEIMKKCLSEISRLDVIGLVFSDINGVIGMGVYDEINHAKKINKKIYYIKNHNIYECFDIKFKMINENRRFFAIVDPYFIK